MDIINLIIGIVSFSIGIIGAFFISLPGLRYSKKAFEEAKGAKIAATEAGAVVNLQSTTLEVSDISHMCELEPTISFFDISKKYMSINNKISSIIGQYEQLPDSGCKDILLSISNKMSEIQIQMNTFNPGEPAMPESEQDGKYFVYYRFRNLFEELAGELNKLKGILKGQLIINKK